jgi:hypothetical protein
MLTVPKNLSCFSHDITSEEKAERNLLQQYKATFEKEFGRTAHQQCALALLKWPPAH